MTKNNTKRKRSKSLQDYLSVLKNVSKRKQEKESYLASCPLGFNHNNNDDPKKYSTINGKIKWGQPSLLISKGDRVNVIYYCLSNGNGRGDEKCNQKNLTAWFDEALGGV